MISFAIKNNNPLFSRKSNYLLEICICSACVLYMQYTKFKWIVATDSSGLLGLLQYCYPELYGVVFFLFIGLLSKRNLLIFIAFLLYYYLAVFNFTSWFIQGRPFSFVDIYRSAQLFLFYPEFLSEIETGLKIKVLIFIVMPLAAVILVRLLALFERVRTFKPSIFLRRISAGIILLVVLSLPVGIYAGAFHHSTIVEVMGDAYRDLKISRMALHPDQSYRVLGVSAEGEQQESAVDFRSKNILFYIIETAPFDVYPPFEELCESTANKWLKGHSRIYNQHYAPYPESERAIFSIISGQYPPLVNGDAWKQRFNSFSLADFLKTKGYATYFIGTAPLEFHNDRAMMEGLGFETIEDVKETLSARIVVNGKKDWDRTKIYRFDEILKEKALDILSFHGNMPGGKPFFMVLAPQSSHAPFQVPPGNKKVTIDKQKIRLNAIWQFELLKSLIDELGNLGQLENTVIVVTGDHGIRSRYESALFADPKVLQSISFHVPLLIAFTEMKSSVVDDYVTSHVDIAPTFIRAFHPEHVEYRHHGIDLFAPLLPDRNVFMFGGGYLPVSGLVYAEGYNMDNRYLGLYFKSQVFNFESGLREELLGVERDDFVQKMMSVKALIQSEN